MWLRELFEQPKHCCLCANSCRLSELVCKTCQSEVHRQLNPRSLDCERLGSFPLWSAGDFEAAYARFLKILKAQPHGLLNTLAHDFLESLALHWVSRVSESKPDFVCSIPGQPYRLLWQSDLGALWGEHVARALNLSLEQNLLKGPMAQWLRGGSGQKALGRKQRLSGIGASQRWNLQDATAKKLKARGLRRVLLVDDVCTTGSSLIRAAIQLRQNDFEVIGAFTLARRKIRWPA